MKASPILASTRRRPSLSLVGPSFSVGITTVSASELDLASDFSLGASAAPPLPSLVEWKSSWEKPSESSIPSDDGPATLCQAASCESFNTRDLNSGEWDVPYYNLEDQSSAEVLKCVDVLDRVIAWTKALRLRKNGKNGTFGTGIVAPVDSSREMLAGEERSRNGVKQSEDVEQYIGVLDSALFAVKRKPSKNKIA